MSYVLFVHKMSALNSCSLFPIIIGSWVDGVRHTGASFYILSRDRNASKSKIAEKSLGMCVPLVCAK